MKKSIVLASFSALVFTAFSFAADLSESDKQFLTGYEKARTALVSDDLASTKKAGSDLGNAGKDLAAISSLKEAHAAFAQLSDRAKKLVAGQSGYFIVRCPMLKKDWVQPTAKIGNPYGGKEMAECGEIVK